MGNAIHNAQPTAGETSQDCVQLRREFTDGNSNVADVGKFYWNDAVCSGLGTECYYICKIKGIVILLTLKVAN